MRAKVLWIVWSRSNTLGLSPLGGGGGRVCGCGGRGANRGDMVVCVTSRTGVMLMHYLIRTDTIETVETVRINEVSKLRRLEFKIMYVI